MRVFFYFVIMLFKFNEKFVKEEVIPIYNEEGYIYEINLNITINGYKEIEINPMVFEALREYKDLKKGDKTLIKINILSKDKYIYEKESFVIETDDFKADRGNYEFLEKCGFDGKKINKIFIPWEENLKEKEANKEKIKEAYDYFYLNILEFSYDGKIYYSLDNYKDINYNKGFKLYININDNYRDIYKDYNYYGKVSFKLEKYK